MTRSPRALVACAFLTASAAYADTAAPSDIEALRKDIAEARARLDAEQQRLADMESRLAALAPATTAAPSSDAALEAEFGAALAAGGPAPAPEPAPAPSAGGGGGVKLRLLDLSVDGLFAAGGSTANDDELAYLNAGGHDPHERGFTVQNVEVSMLGAVDPYVKGEVHVILQIDSEGETGVELEEAFLTTQQLPAGLQLKAGQFFTDFGRLNPTHPHSWSFANQPVILSRVLGPDGLRGPGARLSWLTPAPWYSEVFVGVQKPGGETAVSFFGTEEQEPIGGHPVGGGKVRAPEDLLLTGRWLNSLTLSKQTTLNLGASLATGPNGSGTDTRTDIVGIDAYLKWQRATNQRGFPFVAWQTEWLKRRYEAGEFIDESGAVVPQETLRDSGWYTQVTWGFRPGWTVAWRLDRAEGDESLALDRRLDPMRDRRTRASAALTWYPTEFSKLRFQYDWDRAQFLSGVPGESDDAHSLWIQWEFTMGAHGAHSF